MPHIGIPMVCFSDIPDSFISPHKNKYGPYGIALSKEWGIAKGITPVTYIHSNSNNYSSLQTLMEIFEKNSGAIRENDFMEKTEFNGKENKFYKMYGEVMKFENAFANLLFLFKPYSGDDFLEKNVCFYDEREWRFYPSGINPAFLPRESYIGENGKLVLQRDYRESLDYVKECYTLKFLHSDIKSIFVQTNEEKEKLIDKIGNSYIIQVGIPIESIPGNHEYNN